MTNSSVVATHVPSAAYASDAELAAAGREEPGVALGDPLRGPDLGAEVEVAERCLVVERLPQLAVALDEGLGELVLPGLEPVVGVLWRDLGRQRCPGGLALLEVAHAGHLRDAELEPLGREEPLAGAGPVDR